MNQLLMINLDNILLQQLKFLMLLENLHTSKLLKFCRNLASEKINKLDLTKNYSEKKIQFFDKKKQEMIRNYSKKTLIFILFGIIKNNH